MRAYVPIEASSAPNAASSQFHSGGAQLVQRAGQ